MPELASSEELGTFNPQGSGAFGKWCFFNAGKCIKYERKKSVNN